MPEASSVKFKPGSEVEIFGLMGRADLNGKTGKVQKLLENGRVGVEVVYEGHNKGSWKREVVAVKPQNLRIETFGALEVESHDIPQHEVEGDFVEDVQAAIDSAASGDIVVLTRGTYRWKNKAHEGILQISKPIRLRGSSDGDMKDVTLHCDFEVNDKTSHDGSVTVANLTIKGGVKVQTNRFESVAFRRATLHQTDPKSDGVMVHIMKRGTCLFFGCEIIGGDEALYIDGIDDLAHSKEDNEDRVHIKRTIIRNGAKRGICADDKFILEKSIIKDNGWYGIRSNRGWTDRGGNDWQKNPTKPNQSPTGGNGMFDGIHFPMNGSGGAGMFGSGRTGDLMFPGFGQTQR